MKFSALRLSVVILLTLSGACTTENQFFEDPEERTPCDVGQLVIESFDLATPNLVDILIVVDNSSGMRESQDAFGESMPGFISALNSLDGLDWQLGVTSTDIVHSDQQGRLQTGLPNQAGCPGDRPLIITSDTPGAGDVAACNVVLGEGGDEFEAGLEAVRYALLGPAAQPGGENEGFLRQGSRLVVIVLSDEDDCSDDGDLDRSDPNECVWDSATLMPIKTYVKTRTDETCGEGEDCFFFNRIRGTAGQPVSFAAIVGPDDGVVYERPDPPEAVCASNGTALSASRYITVVDAMGSRGGFFSICNRSYEDSLTRIAEDLVAPVSELICPFLHLTQEPVSVRLVGGEPETTTPIPYGANGYVYAGGDDTCSTGRLFIAPESHGRLGANERIEVHYCTDDPLPQ